MIDKMHQKVATVKKNYLHLIII